MANEIDLRVGNRVAQRRNELGLTQVDLAKRLNVTTEELGAFELGQKRIGARLLQEITVVLKAPVSFFLRDERDNRKNLSIVWPIALCITLRMIEFY